MKNISWVFLLVVFYFGASFFHGGKVKDTVQEIIDSNIKFQSTTWVVNYKVEQVNLSGHFLFDSIRTGVAMVYIYCVQNCGAVIGTATQTKLEWEDILLSVNILTVGNGLWDDVRVEISGEELWKLSVGMD